MKKRVAAVLAVVVLAGCEAAPTISAEGVGESRDGGVILGSGNRAGSDSTVTNTNTTSTDDGRGGVIFGSGN
jgi:hypothetical protein